MGNLRKTLTVILSSIALVLGIGLAGAAPAQAYTISYTYHYDYHCQMNVRYAGEPFTPGYLVKWWYRTQHTIYTPVEKYWHGFTDKHVTTFSHREYPRQIRCWAAYG